VGGSIPERADGDRLYNTCFVYGRDGRLLGRHRKVRMAVLGGWAGERVGQGRCGPMRCRSSRRSATQHSTAAQNMQITEHIMIDQHCQSLVVTFLPTNNEIGACRSPIAGALVRHRHPWKNHFQGVADADPRPGADCGGLRGKHCPHCTPCTVLRALYCMHCTACSAAACPTACCRPACLLSHLSPHRPD
jgi:hypothetical protein